jgi:hypothetical protein
MSMYSPSEPPAWEPMPGRQPYGPPPPGYEEPGYGPEEPHYGGQAQMPYGAMEASYGAMDPSYDMDMDDEMAEDDPDIDERPEPNGGVAAAIIAAGIGCAVLGLLVVAAAASPQVSQWLTLYEPTGPLSGKAIVSSVIYLVIWPNLHYRLRDKQVDLYKAFMITIILVALGIIGTFPPVYQLFARR